MNVLFADSIFLFGRLWLERAVIAALICEKLHLSM
jgi:hypothetical protein